MFSEHGGFCLSYWIEYKAVESATHLFFSFFILSLIPRCLCAQENNSHVKLCIL